MNELREEIAMCAHMRVRNKKVLLDGTESGRIRDSWVCEDCGTLFVPLLAANREQKAEIERLKRIVDVAKVDRIDMKAKLDAFNSGGFADADAMAGKYLEEKAIVDRVWAALGISTYEQAGGKAIDEIVASLRASVGEKWIAYSESKPAYGETVEVLFSGPEIALCHREREELADDDMRQPQDILWDENGDQERSVMGIFWRKFAPPTLPGEEK